MGQAHGRPSVEETAFLPLDVRREWQTALAGTLYGVTFKKALRASLER
jgi:hypothetical protein